MSPRCLLACLALSAASALGCGSSPVAPGGAATSTNTTAVRSGSYTMGVSTSSPASFGNTLSCFMFAASMGGPVSSPGESIAFPVSATVDGSHVIVRATGPGDLGLTADFTVSTAGVITGALSGQVRDVSTGVTLSFSQWPADVSAGTKAIDPTIVGFSGLTSNLLEVTGPITGRVELAVGGSARVCSGATWTITPR